ncbi:RNA ligase family protein [Streptomyces spectabilis]|uniref:RNA ligase family protein n=1 Tax=Streptomyces spectabilis TaxID=68270 RepID=UPI0033D0DE4A
MITEKLDGTNSAVHITAVSDWREAAEYPLDSYGVTVDGTIYVLTAQSRKRIITPGKTTDNFGFAAWVYDNAADLVRILGEGLHYGEWWGKGIQRGYGLDGRRFSLFNTARWFATGEDGLDSMSTRAETSALAGQIDVAPVLYQGPFAESVIWRCVDDLREFGSTAVPGFESPEGVCVFHTATRQVWKVTTDVPASNPHSLDVRRDAGKWEAEAA